MSLQVWLPLNGSIDNQGICDTVVASSTNPQYTTGKLGQGINLNQRVNFIGLPKMNNFSIFFWAKVDSCTSDWADLLGFTCNKSDDTTAPEFRFEGTKSTRACSWHNNGTTGYGISSGTQILIQNYEEWHHVGVVYDGDNIYSYIDGILTYTNSGLGGYLIDDFHIGQTGVIVGVMSDLRIYDTALSKSEVKEISHTCILHYSFDDKREYENLIVESNELSSWVAENCTKSLESDEKFGNCIKVVSSKANGRIYRNLSNVWTENNQTWTVSFWAKSDEDGVIIDASRSITDFSEEFILTTEWHRYVGYITTTGTNTAGTLSIRIIASGKTIYIANVSLVKGVRDVAWFPNKEDELYSQLGFNDTTIYDESGYGNNGIKSKDIDLSDDCSLGVSSLNLIGTDYTTYVRVPNYPQLEKDFTWNVWVKQSDASTPRTMQAVISQGRDWVGDSSSGEDCGFNIFLVTGIPQIRYGNWTDGGGNKQLQSSEALDDNWHMITASIDSDGIGRLYVDGELKTTASTATTCAYSQASGNLVIGKMSYSYLSTNQFFPFNGLVDDIKLFASTLSDEDIKKLYEVKSNINKTGQIMCSNFVETNITGNFFTDDQFPTGVTGNAGTVMKGELVDCKYANTGKATKLTCTTAGNGFYISGRGAFGSTSVLEDGKQYVWSMYIKSDNRTSIRFNVECSSKQSKTSFTIGKEYKKIYSVYTYQSGKQYTAFTCYPSFNLNDNIYIHSFKVEEYNPDALLDKKGNLKNNCFIENEDIEKCYIYKQDIQTNQIIEI